MLLNINFLVLCQIIIFLVILQMSLLDQLDVEHENSLHALLGAIPLAFDPSPQPFEHHYEAEEKQICVTYKWIWDDDEPMQSVPIQEEENDDKAISDMKQARTEQQEKVKQFMAKLKPLTILPRKVSLEVKTQAGSPKKKKIRKLASFK